MTTKKKDKVKAIRIKWPKPKYEKGSKVTIDGEVLTFIYSDGSSKTLSPTDNRKYLILGNGGEFLDMLDVRTLVTYAEHFGIKSYPLNKKLS